MRTGQSGVYGLLANTKMGAAFSDTAYCGTGGQKSRAPRNIIMLPTFIGIDAIVGAKANTTITEAEVKANMRKCVEQIKACDIPVLSLYVHDFKTDPSGADYAEGLDQEELDWLLDVVDEEGGNSAVVEYTQAVAKQKKGRAGQGHVQKVVRQAVIDAHEQDGRAPNVEDVLTEAVKHMPYDKAADGAKDRRRDIAFKALESLIAMGELVSEKGKIKNVGVEYPDSQNSAGDVGDLA